MSSFNVGSEGPGDQRNFKDTDLQEKERYNEGQVHSHQANDSKDQRSIANRLAAEERKHKDEDDPETAMLKKDPTLPAESHGNEPSKGAKIDAAIMVEEQAELRKKGKA